VLDAITEKILKNVNILDILTVACGNHWKTMGIRDLSDKEASDLCYRSLVER
jgi:hypothetical protein